MSRTRSPLYVAIAVLLPLVTLAFGVVRSEYRMSRSTEWEFSVRGFDPRDLLRGHYINYSIELGEPDPAVCADDDPDCCYCLTRAAPTSTAEPAPVPVVARARCSRARRDCDGALRTRAASSLNRFYVAESRARDIEAELREGVRDGEARIVLAIDGMGRAHVTELRVRGKRLE